MTVTHPTVTVSADFTTNLATGTAYHEQVLVSAPYAYHRLKETSGTFADASGNGKTGTGAGSITYNQTTTPVVGDSTARNVNFTTDTTRIDLVGATPSGNLLTLEAFVYVTSLAAKRVIFENDGSTLTKTLLDVVINTDGSISARATDGAATVSSAAGQFVINTWYHVVVVFDGTLQEIRFYRNGVVLSTGTWRNSRSATPSLAKLQLTWRWGTDSSASQGSIHRLAEPAIYLRGLTTTEIADHYGALAVTPFAGYSWTDITQWVLWGSGLRRTFGRASELEDVVPFQTEFTLRNDDRRFEPEYATVTTSAVANPGFEVNTANWTVQAATLTRVTSQFHSGVASGQVVTTNTDEGVFTSATGLTPGRFYELIYWIKGTATESVYTYIQAPDVVVNATYLTLDGTWQKFTVGFTTNDATATIFIHSASGAQTLFLDDVQLWTTFYPYLVPGRPVRVQMVQDAVTYDWAHGFIEDWPQEWDAAGKMCRVPIRASCFLARLGEEDIGARDFTQQTPKARLEVLLNAAGQPTSMRDLDTGVSTIMALAADTNTVGTHAKAVARTDRGLFFFDGRGYATYHAADHRTTDARSTTSQGTLGDESGEIPYSRPAFHAPKDRIRNEITLRRPGGVDQVTNNQASRQAFGKRSYNDELLLTTDALVATRAAELLSANKDQHLRVRAITFNPAKAPGFWSHALGVQLSDRYLWQFRPAQGDSRSRSVFVEGVTDDYTMKVYTSTWFLSTA